MRGECHAYYTDSGMFNCRKASGEASRNIVVSYSGKKPLCSCQDVCETCHRRKDCQLSNVQFLNINNILSATESTENTKKHLIFKIKWSIIYECSQLYSTVHYHGTNDKDLFLIKETDNLKTLKTYYNVPLISTLNTTNTANTANTAIISKHINCSETLKNLKFSRKKVNILKHFIQYSQHELGISYEQLIYLVDYLSC